jgi:hypothetical protein
LHRSRYPCRHTEPQGSATPKRAFETKKGLQTNGLTQTCLAPITQELPRIIDNLASAQDGRVESASGLPEPQGTLSYHDTPKRARSDGRLTPGRAPLAQCGSMISASCPPASRKMLARAGRGWSYAVRLRLQPKPSATMPTAKPAIVNARPKLCAFLVVANAQFVRDEKSLFEPSATTQENWGNIPSALLRAPRRVPAPSPGRLQTGAASSALLSSTRQLSHSTTSL